MTEAEEFPFGREYWEERYGEPGMTWSGNPNAVLVAEAGSLTPGRALDIGSGEGGDALWLARRGWQVTGVDIADNALKKARALAESTDPDAAGRILWEQHDLTEWAPAPRSYELVSSQFMHLPEPARSRLFRGLGTAVAPGGTLLIVGHDPEAEREGHHTHLRELMFTAADVVAALTDDGLHIEVAESRLREVIAHDGTTSTMSDVIVRATRPV